MVEPNGTVRWYKYHYEDLDHSELYPPIEQRPEVLNSTFIPRALITGDYIEIYTIIRGLISLDAKDYSRGIYECQVCVDEGLSETEVCHSANTTIANVGRPPILDVGVGRGEFDARIMPIGEQMQHVSGSVCDSHRSAQQDCTIELHKTCGICDSVFLGLLNITLKA